MLFSPYLITKDTGSLMSLLLNPMTQYIIKIVIF